MHMWFVVRRFMGEGPDGKAFVQNLYNLWLSDIEYRLQDSGVKWRFKKWMKILESQFFTASLHYDEALSYRGRFGLPMALWYHVFLEDTDGKYAPWLEDYMLLQVSEKDAGSEPRRGRRQKKGSDHMGETFSRRSAWCMRADRRIRPPYFSDMIAAEMSV